MESTRKIRQDRSFLKIFTFWSTFVQKSTFGNWTFAQFLSFEWRNGSQNRNVLEKLSGTSPFWNFWLFGQGQGSTWSKHFLFIPFFLFNFFFFFFFSGGSDRVRFPGRSGSNRVVEGDVIHDVMRRGHVPALGASSAWKRVRGLYRRVTALEKTLKFSGLVDLRPLKTPVRSVLWNFEEVRTNLKD